MAYNSEERWEHLIKMFAAMLERREDPRQVGIQHRATGIGELP
jgi:hypothetical protein